MSTRERSTSSFVSILCCNSVRRWPLARFASMQSSSISMNAAVMCLRYSNFSGFLMFVVRSFTRIMLRTIRCRSCKLSMLLLLKRVEGGLVGHPHARFSDCQITGFPGYKRHGSRRTCPQSCGSRCRRGRTHQRSHRCPSCPRDTRSARLRRYSTTCSRPRIRQ